MIPTNEEIDLEIRYIRQDISMIQSRLSDLEYYTEQIFDDLKSIKNSPCR